MKPVKQNKFLAHIKKSTAEGGEHREQELWVHLTEVAEAMGKSLAPVGLDKLGELIGFLHDFGKYSLTFLIYLQSATGLLDQDSDEYIDPIANKGKIDHSTAGAQFIWRKFKGAGRSKECVAQIAALCIASHHSGLIDVLKPDGSDSFGKRMEKADKETRYEEAIQQADPEVTGQIEALISAPELMSESLTIIQSIMKDKQNSKVVRQFHLGLLVRLVFSALIDADRTNSIDFEWPERAKARQSGSYPQWSTLIARLERKLESFESNGDLTNKNLKVLRADVADHCLTASSRAKGLFTLCVPTGGGKTLSSLRFALHHANEKQLKRVVFVLPYTTIIEQNSADVRDILEPFPDEKPHSVVLEHHANLLPPEEDEDKKHRWRNQLLSENWDAPVIFTTNVQLLECLFGGGTRSVRRMHQLSNAVIVFDEIQALPVKMVHLFNNAMNFLVSHGQSSVVLCSATQPLLHKVNTDKGALKLGSNSEIIPDPSDLFAKLKRVDVLDRTRPEGWQDDEIAAFALDNVQHYGSCLVVVNTKLSAKNLYEVCKHEKVNVFHLSTHMCPAHRRVVLTTIKTKLQENQPVLCISTQLIEAGVNISFGSAIRYLAGMDSIAQTAGRCNRHGERDVGIVSVINAIGESLGDSLSIIKTGQKITERIFRELKSNPERFDNDLVGPKIMTRYYDEFFLQQASEMSYAISGAHLERDDTLLNMLALNCKASREHKKKEDAQCYILRQSFQSAARQFKAIDAPTRGVIVGYGSKGKALVNELLGASSIEEQKEIISRAQPYTVNVYPYVFEKLRTDDALLCVPGTEIYCLKEQYYSDAFGLSTEPSEPMSFFSC